MLVEPMADAWGRSSGCVHLQVAIWPQIVVQGSVKGKIWLCLLPFRFILAEMGRCKIRTNSE
jgi:hypothetical protein